MSLRVAIVRTGFRHDHIHLNVTDVDSKEEMQAGFDKDIKPPDEPRTVVGFFTFDGEAAESFKDFLERKGDNFVEELEGILRTICFG